MSTFKFKKDVHLDACATHAAMRGMLVPFLIQIGMTPNEATARGEWLKKQPHQYIAKIVKEVKRMEMSENKKDRTHRKGSRARR